MQVNLVSPTGPSRSHSSLGREVLLAELMQVLRPDEAAQARHAQIVERRAEKLRRKDERQDIAAARTAAAPRLSERMQQVERDLAPGRRAAQRDQWREAAQQSVETGRREFRRALADAGARGRRSHTTNPQHSSSDPVPPAKNGTPSNAGQPTRSGRSAAPSSPAPAPVAHLATHAAPTASSAQRGTPTVTTGASPAPAAGAALAPAARAVTTSAAAGRVAAVSAAASASASPARTTQPAVSAVVGARGGVTAGKIVPRPVAHSAATAESNSDANVERILRVIQSRLGKDRSVATLRLDPPELGTVRLRLDLRQEQLLLQVETQTPEAQRLLEDGLDTLRRNLEAAGIHLERIEIRAATPAQQSPEPQTRPQAEGWTGAQQQAARQDAGSAGGGPSWEPEAPRAESPEMPGGDAEVAPAAESLVNVLA